MILTYVVDDGNGLYWWADEKDNLPGKGLQKIKEFSIYKLFSQKENDILKKTSQEIVLKISEETFYNIYPHMLLLKEFYKAHIKIRDNMRGDFLEHMSKLLEKTDENS